jgi:pimeloyl-ACP methyl ester carboxylesterase
MLTESAVRTQLSELCNFARSAAEAGSKAPFPAVPLTVLSRGRAEFRDSPSGRARERAWATLQDSLAQLTKGARHIVVQGAGHAVHLEGGAQVAAAAVTSVLMARAGGAFGDARLRVARQP